jgi:hypothetical protein
MQCLSKLDDLEEEVKKQNVSTVAFVDALRDLKEVNVIANNIVLNPNHKTIVKKFENSMKDLHKEFSVPITPKIQIIFEHLSETFEKNGSTLLRRTDQTVESTHSLLDKFIKSHNYQIRDVESGKAGDYLLKAITHFNSYNLSKK